MAKSNKSSLFGVVKRQYKICGTLPDGDFHFAITDSKERALKYFQAMKKQFLSVHIACGASIYVDENINLLP